MVNVDGDYKVGIVIKFLLFDTNVINIWIWSLDLRYVDCNSGMPISNAFWLIIWTAAGQFRGSAEDVRGHCGWRWDVLWLRPLWSNTIRPQERMWLSIICCCYRQIQLPPSTQLGNETQCFSSGEQLTVYLKNKVTPQSPLQSNNQLILESLEL